MTVIARNMLVIWSWLCIFTCCLDGTISVKFKVVDLTHELSDSTIYWPGNPAYNFTILWRGLSKGGFWYESNYIAQAEHGGTHLDAPSHFYEARWRTHQIPMENLCGPAAIIDVKSKASNNPDYMVTVDDVNVWEKRNGKIPEKAVVIMNSGWGSKYPNKTEVFNTQTPDDAATFHFPAWHVETVKWLIKERDIRLLGVDTPSTDIGQSTTFLVHQELAKNNVSGIENVANLDKLPAEGSYVFAAVMKIRSGSGGPARVFAQIFIDQETSNAMTKRQFALPYIIIALITLMFH